MSHEVLSYYRAALWGLRFVEQRRATGRRFGPDADALWKGFAGELTTADRIDLMIRDADAQWPGAFGARTVFGLEGVAEDDPFGPDWAPLDPVDAEDLWREITRAAPPADVPSTLSRIAAAWGLELSPTDLPAVSATDALVVAGPSAIASLIRAFSEGSDLDWADQVNAVASIPAHRQLAAAAGALLNLTKPVRLLRAGETTQLKRGAKLTLSPDADPADAAAAPGLIGA